jgi:catechol 2,3-dioxygenase-like lactoylglutathione lyase family enzyme
MYLREYSIGAFFLLDKGGFMAQPTVKGLGLHIKVKDLDTSRAFYESLGFTPVFAYGSDEFRETLPKELASAPEKYKGMTFKISDSANLEIAEGHIAVKDSSVFQEEITSPKVSAMVQVESLVPLFENKLVNITFPVRHYYWGTLEAAFRDPDGFVLVFIAPYSEEEQAAITKYVAVEEVSPS